MRTQELLANIKNKEFNLEKRLDVKKYLPMEVKKTIAQGIIYDCTRDEGGVVKVDSIERYMSYVRYMITMHTNLEYTDENYDALCSTVYKENTLLNAIMKCFDADATECSRILNLVADDYMQERSIENTVSQFLYKIGTEVDSLSGILAEKVNEFNFSNMLPDGYDVEKVNNFIKSYLK
jgi:hypothetical protein